MHTRSLHPITVSIALRLLCGASPASAELPTSDKCGECHKAIYQTWRNSAHSRAMEDPVFLEAYRDAEALEDKQVSRSCLRCHAPLAEVNQDWGLLKKTSWEGVNCDVCHGLLEVDFSGPTPRGVLEIGDVKRGPIAEAQSAAHEVAYSKLHTTAAACAWCHEFQSPDGAPLMSTYSEWQSSSFARKGVTCQECHMARTKGNVVDPRIARAAGTEINLHEVPGGHSIDQLNKALRIAMEPERAGDSLFVKVRLTNKGAGHAVPTGMPGRRVILEVTVRPYGRPSFSENRIFSRIFTGAGGSVITHDREYFRPGVRVASDTRIAPDEVRTESFRLAVPPDVAVQVGLRMVYEHLPMGDPETGTRLIFFTESRTLKPTS